jgi:glycosyltransferase involved in cell wall biosynthesis
MSSPQISCLCVTRKKKFQLERVIRCFKAQTYPNKDLLILYEDNDPITEQVISKIEDKSISSIKIPSNPKLTLGQLRNISIQECKGDFFCQWDDDDWYHRQRLEHQMNSILYSHKPASLLPYWIMFDAMDNQAYMSHMRLWEGSILCNKSLLKEDLAYAHYIRGEDQFFVDKLIAKNLVFPLVMPQLYIYTYDGNNTWDRSHFEFLFKYSQKLSDESSILLKHILEHKYNEQEGSDILSSVSFLESLRYVH